MNGKNSRVISVAEEGCSQSQIFEGTTSDQGLGLQAAQEFAAMALKKHGNRAHVVLTWVQLLADSNDVVDALECMRLIQQNGVVPAPMDCTVTLEGDVHSYHDLTTSVRLQGATELVVDDASNLGQILLTARRALWKCIPFNQFMSHSVLQLQLVDSESQLPIGGCVSFIALDSRACNHSNAIGHDGLPGWLRAIQSSIMQSHAANALTPGGVSLEHLVNDPQSALLPIIRSAGPVGRYLAPALLGLGRSLLVVQPASRGTPSVVAQSGSQPSPVFGFPLSGLGAVLLAHQMKDVASVVRNATTGNLSTASMVAVAPQTMPLQPAWAAAAMSVQSSFPNTLPAPVMLDPRAQQQQQPMTVGPSMVAHPGMPLESYTHHIMPNTMAAVVKANTVEMGTETDDLHQRVIQTQTDAVEQQNVGIMTDAVGDRETTASACQTELNGGQLADMLERLTNLEAEKSLHDAELQEANACRDSALHAAQEAKAVAEESEELLTQLNMRLSSVTCELERETQRRMDVEAAYTEDVTALRDEVAQLKDKLEAAQAALSAERDAKVRELAEAGEKQKALAQEAANAECAMQEKLLLEQKLRLAKQEVALLKERLALSAEVNAAQRDADRDEKTNGGKLSSARGSSAARASSSRAASPAPHQQQQQAPLQLTRPSSPRLETASRSLAMKAKKMPPVPPAGSAQGARSSSQSRQNSASGARGLSQSDSRRSLAAQGMPPTPTAPVAGTRLVPSSSQASLSHHHQQQQGNIFANPSRGYPSNSNPAAGHDALWDEDEPLSPQAATSYHGHNYHNQQQQHYSHGNQQSYLQSVQNAGNQHALQANAGKQRPTLPPRQSGLQTSIVFQTQQHQQPAVGAFGAFAGGQMGLLGSAARALREQLESDDMMS